MSLPLLLLLVDHRGCGVPRVRFAVPDKTAENADHESLDAATEFDAAASDSFLLDGTVLAVVAVVAVIAVIAWC